MKYKPGERWISYRYGREIEITGMKENDFSLSIYYIVLRKFEGEEKEEDFCLMAQRFGYDSNFCRSLVPLFPSGVINYLLGDINA